MRGAILEDRTAVLTSATLALGGRFQVEGNAGGTVLECDAPRRYLVSWEIMGGASQVEVVVEPDGDGARLTLTHSGENVRDFYEQFGPGGDDSGDQATCSDSSGRRRPRAWSRRCSATDP